MSGAETYARWVLDPENAIKTGRLIKLAAQRFLCDLEREDIYFDENEAIKMVNFGERYCKQWEGDWAGKAVKFELWQKFLFEQIYGWIRKDNGRRRFTKFYLQIAKKNGKSTMCAVLSLYHLFADDRVNTPKIFTAANNEDQAKICVNMAGKIVEASEDLYEFVADNHVGLMTYKENITEVIHYERNGFIKAMSKESGDKKLKTSGGKHGINASLGLVDEFGMSPDHGASGSISTSMMSRLERLMAYFTTAGYNMEGPCFSELRAQGVKVLEKQIAMDNYLPLIFEMDSPVDEQGKPMDITTDFLIANPDRWGQCNPNLGISVNPEALQEALAEAKNSGGKVEVDVMTLNFNRWMDSPEVFISTDIWNRNTHGIEESELLGRECYGGIEISSGKMLSSFTLLFPDVRGKFAIKTFFWMPEEAKRDYYKLAEWVDSGLIWMDSGNVVDNDWIYGKLVAEISKYNLHSFAFKTNLETHSIVQSLIKGGTVGQPISHGIHGISTPTVMWEEMAGRAEFEHFKNPVMVWQNSNCMAVRKNNDIRIEKQSGKVVGIYSAINSLAQWCTIDKDDQNDKIIESW